MFPVAGHDRRQNWVDSSSNGSGSLPADGDITGVNHCVTATAYVQNGGKNQEWSLP